MSGSGTAAAGSDFSKSKMLPKFKKVTKCLSKRSKTAQNLAKFEAHRTFLYFSQKVEYRRLSKVAQQVTNDPMMLHFETENGLPTFIFC